MKLYVCARSGHRFRSERPFRLTFRVGDTTVLTGPLCPECFVSWMDTMFGTAERKEKWEPPQVGEKRLENAIDDAGMADLPRRPKKRPPKA